MGHISGSEITDKPQFEKFISLYFSANIIHPPPPYVALLFKKRNILINNLLDRALYYNNLKLLFKIKNSLCVHLPNEFPH